MKYFSKLDSSTEKLQRAHVRFPPKF